MKEKFLSINDSKYPDPLSQVYRPPQKLFYRGDPLILSGNLIAFVGTRNFTPYGKFAVEKLIGDLSLCDIVIVSGLAKGIDTLAHRAALDNGMKTVAVLGTGISCFYPPENLKLAEEIIAKGGCIVSEYYGDAAPLTFHFPERNRIIAGLSLATVVVEAPESSGALINAKRANESDREVFAVPGDIDRLESVGCNKLIQDSAAIPVLSGIDIIRELKIQPSFFKKNKIKDDGKVWRHLDGNVLKVFESIPKTKPVSIERIIEASGLPLNEINKALSLLEISMFIVSTNSGFYLRTV